MARIRSIKPDFWNDEKISDLAFGARLTFIGLWNLSDDYGVVRANPKWVRSQLYPYDESLRTEQVGQWLDALASARMVVPLTLNGEGYFYIRTFRDHQKVDNPSVWRNCTEEELQSALKAEEGKKQGSPRTPRGLPEESTPPPRRNKEEEKDQEKERDVGKGNTPPADAGDKPGRPRNPVWDCLCEVFGLEPVTKSERSRLGKAVREFTEKGAIPSEIRIRASRYRQQWPQAAFTAEALFKHWDLMGQSTGRGVNGAAVNKHEIEETMRRVLDGSDDL